MHAVTPPRAIARVPGAGVRPPGPGSTGCGRGGTSRALPVLLMLVLAAGALARPPAVRAQRPVAGELVVLGINALLGGATAGLSAYWHDGSFLHGLGVGALGGSAVYAGKRLSAADAPGAGLAGRMVAAMGASVVRNGAAAREPLQRMILPLGPASLYLVVAPDSPRARPKLNLGRSLYLGYLVLDDDYEVDWWRSLSAGAPVFVGRGTRVHVAGSDAGGFELLGAIALSDPALVRSYDAHALLAHERVHVLQDDFMSIAWADPVEDWLLERIPGGEHVRPYVDTDVPYLGLMLLGVAVLPYDRRPWELEARYFGAGP